MKKTKFNKYLPQINILQARGFLLDINSINNISGYYEINRDINPLSATNLPFSYGFIVIHIALMNNYIYIKQTATNFEGTIIRERIYWKDSWKAWTVLA